MASSGTGLFYVFGGFVLGLFVFIKGLLWFKEKRLIEDIPTSTIRSIAMGLVEIYGKAFPSDSTILKGPFAKKDCCHYKATVEKLVSSGKSSHWEVIKTEERGDHFYIQDETGKVLVETKEAQLEIPVDFEFQTGFHKSIPQDIAAYLKANSIPTQDFFHFDYTMKFKEYDIEVEDKLFVLGTAGRNPFKQETESAEHTEDIMIQKGQDKQLFLISEKSKREEMKNLGRNTILALLGGGALTIGCLFFILLSFNLL